MCDDSRCLFLVFRFGGAALAVCCIRSFRNDILGLPRTKLKRALINSHRGFYAETGFRVPLSRLAVSGIISCTVGFCLPAPVARIVWMQLHLSIASAGPLAGSCGCRC